MTNASQKPTDLSSTDQINKRDPAEDYWHRIAESGLRFSDDMILKAGPISQWLWGKWNPRKCYYLAERTNCYPFFTENAQLAIRKSTVLAHVWAREKRAFTENDESLVKLAILLSRLSELVSHTKEPSDFGRPNAIHLWMALLQETSRAIDRVLRSA